ncbi:MAG: C39 family peptidase [Bacillota bacterium]|nr:C39 family peptidase [Bacillota bacterium]
MYKTIFIILFFPVLGLSYVSIAYGAVSDFVNTQSQAEQEEDYFPFSYILNGDWEQKSLHSDDDTSIRKDHAMLNVELIRQNPELRFGCEVTSLAMMLRYAGIKTDKIQLFHAIKKDSDPLIRSNRGDILRWGNPDDGFVGDMTGRRAGYAAFDRPIVQLVNRYLPGRALNLTNKPFEEILTHVSKGYPVVVWTTGDYLLPDRWEAWYHGKQVIKTPLDLHAVVLVGFDENNVYINDPLSGKKQIRIDKKQFIASWKALKSRAVSYKKENGR